MNFRKRELAGILLKVENEVVLNIQDTKDSTLVVYAHKDDQLGNQVIGVELCNTLTGELETSQYNIPSDVLYVLRTKELMLIEK